MSRALLLAKALFSWHLVWEADLVSSHLATGIETAGTSLKRWKMGAFQASNCRDYNQGGFSETESSVSLLLGLSQLHLWVPLFPQIHSSSTLVVITGVVLPSSGCSWVPASHLSPYNLPVSVASGSPCERCPPWLSLGCVTRDHHPMWPRPESVRYTGRLDTTS